MSTNGGITEAMRLLDEVVGYAKSNSESAGTRDERETWAAHHRNCVRVQAALAAQKGEGVREGWQVGQRVSVSPNFIDRFGEWRDWKGFVCFIRSNPGGILSIGVSDHWPPKSDGDCTDGFSSDDLIRLDPTPASWNEAVEACKKAISNLKTHPATAAGIGLYNPHNEALEQALDAVAALTRPDPAPEEARK